MAGKLRMTADVLGVTRPARRAMGDEVLATAHPLGAVLQRVGALDAEAMRGLEALCLLPKMKVLMRASCWQHASASLCSRARWA